MIQKLLNNPLVLFLLIFSWVIFILFPNTSDENPDKATESVLSVSKHNNDDELNFTPEVVPPKQEPIVKSHQQSKPVKKPVVKAETKTIPTVKPKITYSKPSYTCNCSKTCEQIASCSEAQFQLKTCGCSRRDGDKDGIACDTAPLHCQN